MNRSVIAALLLSLPGIAAAQSKQDTIPMPLQTCNFDPVGEPENWTTADVERAVSRENVALPSDAAAPAAQVGYVVHVVRYGPDGVTPAKQAWYGWEPGWTSAPTAGQWLRDPDIKNRYKESRLFGKPYVRVIGVYMNVPYAPLSDVRTALERLNRADLTDLTDLQVSTMISKSQIKVADQDGATLGLLGNGVTRLDLKTLGQLTYRALITPKTPQPLADLKDLLSVAAMAGADAVGQVRTTPANLCGAIDVRVDDLPADVKLTAVAGEKELGANTFDNERRYWYDVSFALPIATRDDLSIDSSSGEISAKKIQKADLFAVLNLSPVSFDLKKPQMQLIPRLLYGIPVTGKPLQHHLVALAVGLNRVQAFAGLRFDRIQQVSVSTTDGVPTGTQDGTQTGRKWDHKWVFGLNLPVSTVKKALGGK